MLPTGYSSAIDMNMSNEIDTQTWTDVQNSYVLPNYPATGYPPVTHRQTGIPQANPQPRSTPVAFMGYESSSAQGTVDRPDTATHSATDITLRDSDVIVNRKIMAISDNMRISHDVPLLPRSLKARIQLTVALHLYLEAVPGPLLDEHTIAQVVFNRIYGEPWSAPEESLLSTLNSKPNEKVGQWYAEVINGRETWSDTALVAYSAWHGYCAMVGSEPPVTFKGRWG